MALAPLLVASAARPSNAAFLRVQMPRYRLRGEHLRTALTSNDRVSVCTYSHATRKSISASSNTSTLTSIDVEFAHFACKGQVVTAAAEVCLLAEDGSVLLDSYICPGT